MSQLHQANVALTSVANSYGNCADAFANECLLTPVVVPRRQFAYREFDRNEPFRVHNAKVSCYSQVHEIGQTPSVLVQDIVEDFALEIPICSDEIIEANAGCDPNERIDIENNAVEKIVNDLQMAREQRIFSKALDSSNYVLNQNLLSWAGSELNTANTLDPFIVLKNHIANQPQSLRPNWMVTSNRVLNALQTSPGFIGGSNCCSIQETTARIAAALGLVGICVADAQIDMGTIMQPDVQNIVGDSILLYKRDDNMSGVNCPAGTFAFEARYQPSGQFFTSTRNDNNWDMGARGGVRLRVAHSSKVVFRYDLGCLITDVLV